MIICNVRLLHYVIVTCFPCRIENGMGSTIHACMHNNCVVPALQARLIDGEDN